MRVSLLLFRLALTVGNNPTMLASVDVFFLERLLGGKRAQLHYQLSGLKKALLTLLGIECALQPNL